VVGPVALTHLRDVLTRATRVPRTVGSQRRTSNGIGGRHGGSGSFVTCDVAIGPPSVQRQVPAAVRKSSELESFGSGGCHLSGATLGSLC